MDLDYDWIDLVDVRVRGEARDEVTDASGVTHVAREASVDVETDGGLLTKLDARAGRARRRPSCSANRSARASARVCVRCTTAAADRSACCSTTSPAR